MGQQWLQQGGQDHAGAFRTQWGEEMRQKIKVKELERSREGIRLGGYPPPEDAWEVQDCHLPSMTVMGSPVSILRAPGSVTSLTQHPSEGQACGDRRKGWLGLWPESER